MTKEEIITIRKTKNLSRAEFANELGVSSKSIQNWEEGINNIPLSISKLINALYIREGSEIYDQETFVNFDLIIQRRELLVRLVEFLTKNDNHLMEQEIFQLYIKNKTKDEVIHYLKGKLSEISVG